MSINSHNVVVEMSVAHTSAPVDDVTRVNFLCSIALAVIIRQPSANHNGGGSFNISNGANLLQAQQGDNINNVFVLVILTSHVAGASVSTTTSAIRRVTQRTVSRSLPYKLLEVR